MKSPKSLMVRDRVIMAFLFFPTFLPNGVYLSTINCCLKITRIESCLDILPSSSNTLRLYSPVTC